MKNPSLLKIDTFQTPDFSKITGKVQKNTCVDSSGEKILIPQKNKSIGSLQQNLLVRAAGVPKQYNIFKPSGMMKRKMTKNKR